MNAFVEKLADCKPEQVRTFTLACLVVMAVVFYWHFTSRLVPLREEASSARADFEDDDRACTDLRRKLRKLLEQQAHLATRAARLEREAREVKRGCSRLAASMLRPADLVRVEQETAGFAAESGVRLLSLEKRNLQVRQTGGVSPPFVRRRWVLECSSTFPAAEAFVSRLESARWPVRVARVLLREGKEPQTGVLFTVELDVVVPEPAFHGKPPALARLAPPSPPRVRDLFFRRPRKRKRKKVKVQRVEFGRLALTGIVGGDGERAAVLNGRIVRAGSVVNGAEVVRVEEDMVVLSKQGVRREVRLRSMAAAASPARLEKEKE